MDILPPNKIGWEEIPEGSLQQKYIAQGISVTMGNLPKEIGNEFDNIEKEIRESNFTNARPQNDRLVGHLKKEFEVPEHLRSNAIKSFECDGFGVKYAGDTFHLLNKQNLSNSEWNLGEPSKIKIQQAANQVTGLSSNQYGNYDNYSISNLPFARQVQTIFTNKIYHPGFAGYVAGSGAYHTVIVRFDNYPSAGYTRWSLYINPADVTDNIQGLDGPAWGQHQERGPGDNRPIEFHYTTKDGRGGKRRLCICNK